MKPRNSFVARIDELRDLLTQLAESSPGEPASALAHKISAMFEEDVKYAGAEKRLKALNKDDRDALDCICEYWAKDRIHLGKNHASWVQRAYGLLDYISYYDGHCRRVPRKEKGA